MEYVITFVVAAVIYSITAIIHMKKKAYHRGFDDGYYVGIEFDRRMTENAEAYAEKIRKEERNI